MFQLDDTKSSTTQQQLEALHAAQRVTDPDLDEHIDFLHSLGKLDGSNKSTLSDIFCYNQAFVVLATTISYSVKMPRQ
jgi:hypothetical protein